MLYSPIDMAPVSVKGFKQESNTAHSSAYKIQKMKLMVKYAGLTVMGVVV